MPIYKYSCEGCGYGFEVLYKSISKAETEVNCELCGTRASKQVTAASHRFNHVPTGPVPQNTGTSDDWKFDKIIGRDAEVKWEVINKRNAEKDRLIRDEAKAGRQITRDHLVPSGEAPGVFRTMSEPERVVVNNNRSQAEAARSNLPPLPPLPTKK